MTVTATSSVARAIVSAISLIAASPVWIARQTAYGTDVVNPADRIYGYEANGHYIGIPFSTLRPFAVVETGEELSYNPHVDECLKPTLLLEGGVYVVVQDNARFTDLTTDHINDSYLDFLNFAYGLCDDMDGRFGDSVLDLIGFRGIETFQAPARTEFDQRQNEDYWTAVFRFQFGDLS